MKLKIYPKHALSSESVMWEWDLKKKKKMEEKWEIAKQRERREKPVHADRETSEGTEGRGYGDSLIGPIYHRRGTEGSGQREKTEVKVGLSCGLQRYRFVHLSKSVHYFFIFYFFTSGVSAVSEKRKNRHRSPASLTGIGVRHGTGQNCRVGATLLAHQWYLIVW